MTRISKAMLLAIARNLREFGYPDAKPEYIQAELEKPESQRDIIGMFATRMLADHGITEYDFNQQQ